MRIAITGASGSGKTTLASELARTAGLRHIEIDALHHGPNWESCGPDVLRERVGAASEGDGWVTDSTYHRVLGNFVVERADMLVWLDLPVNVIMWRLLRRTHRRIRDRVELWNGNVEPGWRVTTRYLIVPALRTALANRREFPRRYAGVNMRRLRSDDEVRGFVRSLAGDAQSIQAAARMSGSSNGSERQNVPPSLER
jgi:adenylate kinase family enzyme